MTAIAEEVAQRRAREQRGSVVVRSVSGRPSAEIRAGMLHLRGQPVPLASPYLVMRGEFDRGRVDALGLLLRHCDIDLHVAGRPTDVLQRAIVDILEQLRCESLRPPALRGMEANIDQAFWAWDGQARSDGMAEARLGILVYALTHMARSRLVVGLQNEAVEESIEATWFGLAPMIGTAFGKLKPNRHDQAAYLKAACEVAAIIGELAEQDPTLAAADVTSDARYRLLLPELREGDDDEDGDTDVMSSAGVTVTEADLTARPDLLHAGGYGVWSTDHDIEVAGSSLYPDVVLRRARAELDLLVRQQPMSVARLARQLAAFFSRPAVDGWDFGLEEGHIDGRRLPQLIARPAEHRVFRWQRTQPVSDTVVSFLIDTSGSMKRQRFAAVATLVDTWVRALDLAGLSTEVLGYTTASWSGGEVRGDWLAAGSPPDPGRLNAVQHIVYKAGEQRWRRARRSMAAMLRTSHYREGLDGEALAWAWERLLSRPEERKVLVVISDGSPMDSSTVEANRPGFLDDHLATVARHIERDGRVELGSIGIALDTSVWFRRSMPLQLDDVMTISTYGALSELFS